MRTHKQTARIAGILFIVGTIAGALSAVVMQPVLTEADYLSRLASYETRITIGSLLVLTMAFSLALIPTVMFPIFRAYNEALALGSVIFRGVLESVAYLAIMLSWLLLITIGQQYASADSQDGTTLKAIGDMVLASGDWLNHLLALVFSIGALMMYYLFFASKLIPRWLSVWGIAGAVLYFSVPLLGIFGLEFAVLMAPLALQEMVLAIWLIVKGFNAVPSNYSFR